MGPDPNVRVLSYRHQLLTKSAGKFCMATPLPQQVTRLLLSWNEGDESALEKLTTAVYEELRLLAHRYMRGECANHTLQTTALVNEAYLRLIDGKQVTWQNRAHFFAVSARLMRRILVDWARSSESQKRGGRPQQVTLDEALIVSRERSEDLVALDEALRDLAEVDSRKSEVVELRFFGGLSVEETAEVLKVSQDTVLRDWRLAKLWLLRKLCGEKGDEG